MNPLTKNILELMYFGTGTDGDVTISAGTTVLDRDMYYKNLTIIDTGSINTSGFRIFVSQLLDLSSAPANAITFTPVEPNDASSATGGLAPTGISIGTVSGHQNGTAGGTGTTGVGALGGSVGSNGAAMGGGGGTNGVGGSGVSGAGGASGSGSGATAAAFKRNFAYHMLRGQAVALGGGSARGGPSGAGDGTNSGGGGGGGPVGGGVIWISAKNIKRSSTNTASSCITCLGSRGGNGFAPVTGNCGGGAGAGGGGGGFIYIFAGNIYGSSKSSAISAAGGVGGNGAAGVGTGTAGTGGTGGTGGKILVINLSSGSSTLTSGSAGSAGSGVTGGAGGACSASL